MSKAWEEFKALFEQEGSRKAAERYNRSQRTVQRWYKEEKIPESAVKPKDYIDMRPLYSAAFKAEYEREKKKSGNVNALSEKYGVHVRTIQKWNKDGIPQKGGKFNPEKLEKGFPKKIKPGKIATPKPKRPKYHAFIEYEVSSENQLQGASTPFFNKVSDALIAGKELYMQIMNRSVETDNFRQYRRDEIIIHSGKVYKRFFIKGEKGIEVARFA